MSNEINKSFWYEMQMSGHFLTDTGEFGQIGFNVHIVITSGLIIAYIFMSNN